jgi:peptidyl-tRNA hydrolase
MYLVLRRGAIDSISRGGELAGAAAVACVRAFAGDERLADWRARPRKVCLRARNAAQWQEVLAEPHALAGEADGEAIAALPPRRLSERGVLFERLQAMSGALEPPPERASDGDAPLSYVLNPAATMSSGKTLAQIAHAAVMAADGGDLEEWVAAGCPARVLAPGAEAFAAAGASSNCVARVVDAGLTEIAPGTVTVIAMAGELPPELR